MAARVSALLYRLMRPRLSQVSLVGSFAHAWAFFLFCQIIFWWALPVSFIHSWHSSMGIFPQFVGGWLMSVSSVLHVTPILHSHLFFQSQSISCHYTNPVSVLLLPLCIICLLFSFLLFKLLKSGLMESKEAFLCIGYLISLEVYTYGFIYNPDTGFGHGCCFVCTYKGYSCSVF